MIPFQDAREIALAKIGGDCALVDSATIEKPYGWFFYHQSREYIKTGDIRHMLCGSCGFIVERTNGRVFMFGSAYPREKWIADYERGFKYERYDLTILTVTDFEQTLSLLERLGSKYVLPSELAPHCYGRGELREMLRRLPCTLTNQVFWHRVDVFDEIDASGCCKYELREHRPAESNLA